MRRSENVNMTFISNEMVRCQKQTSVSSLRFVVVAWFIKSNVNVIYGAIESHSLMHKWQSGFWHRANRTLQEATRRSRTSFVSHRNVIHIREVFIALLFVCFHHQSFVVVEWTWSVAYICPSPTKTWTANEGKTNWILLFFFSKSQTSVTLCDINRIFRWKKARESALERTEQCVCVFFFRSIWNTYIILDFEGVARMKQSNDMLDHKISTHCQCLHNILSLIRPWYAHHKEDTPNQWTNQPSKWFVSYRERNHKRIVVRNLGRWKFLLANFMIHKNKIKVFMSQMSQKTVFCAVFFSIFRLK